MKLFQDPFLKNQNWLSLSTNSLKFSTVCFYCKSKLTAIETHVFLFYKKTIFCLSLNFRENAKNYAEIFLTFF